VGYTRTLWGEEITKIELGGLRNHFVDVCTSAYPYVIFTFVGWFKGEHGEHHHLMPVAAVTGSSLEVRKWTQRLLLAKENMGFFQVSCLPGRKDLGRDHRISKLILLTGWYRSIITILGSYST
jgi:hypothetical protein